MKVELLYLGVMYARSVLETLEHKRGPRCRGRGQRRHAPKVRRGRIIAHHPGTYLLVVVAVGPK